MRFDGSERRLGPGHFERVEGVLRAARHGHLCADDVDGRRAAARGGLGHSSERSGAPGGDLVGERGALSGAAHAGVEMQLGKAGPGVGVDHRLRAPHGLVRGETLPGIGAQMIAPEDDAGGIEADPRRNRLDKGAEVRRGHAGVAALLVHLVAGRLDQGAPSAARRLQQRRFDDQGMRRADRRDAGLAVGQARADEGRRAAHCACLEDRADRKASSSARLAAPSIGPCLVTASAPLAAA